MRVSLDLLFFWGALTYYYCSQFTIGVDSSAVLPITITVRSSPILSKQSTYLTPATYPWRTTSRMEFRE